MTDDELDPTLRATLALADAHGLYTVLAALTEAADQLHGGLDWSAVSSDTRTRLVALVASALATDRNGERQRILNTLSRETGEAVAMLTHAEAEQLVANAEVGAAQPFAATVEVEVGRRAVAKVRTALANLLARRAV